MDSDAHDIQVLRLLKSFFEIDRPENRETIVRMAEALASGDSAKATALGFFTDQKPSDPTQN